MPPALVLSMPPICALPWAPQAMGKKRPASAAASCTRCTTQPASATREKSRASMSRMRFSRSRLSTTAGGPPGETTAAPHSPVRPPAGTTAMPAAAHCATTAATSSTVPGRSTASGAPR
jgi:hypothetical protein